MSLQILPKELAAIVLAYEAPAPNEMLLRHETSSDAGLKRLHTQIDICFDYEKIEEAFKRMMALASILDCHSEASSTFYTLIHPTYVFQRAVWFGETPPPTSLYLFHSIENPAPQEDPALPRLRQLFQNNNIVRKKLPPATVHASETNRTVTVNRQAH